MVLREGRRAFVMLCCVTLICRWKEIIKHGITAARSCISITIGARVRRSEVCLVCCCYEQRDGPNTYATAHITRDPKKHDHARDSASLVPEKHSDD